MTYDQRGQKVNNQVNINIESSEKLFFQQGINALKNKNYFFATSCFEKSFTENDNNSDSEKHYYLALSLLGGSRPRLHTLSSVRSIEEHLQIALNNNSKHLKACVLWAIVKYDYYVLNRISENPPSASELARQGHAITRSDIDELLFHIQASDNEIWEWINSRH